MLVSAGFLSVLKGGVQYVVISCISLRPRGRPGEWQLLDCLAVPSPRESAAQISPEAKGVGLGRGTAQDGTVSAVATGPQILP